MSNKSSIEWFDEQLCKRMAFEDIEVANWYLEIFEQVKKMHKEEIIEAFSLGDNQQGFENEALDYYNTTFEK